MVLFPSGLHTSVKVTSSSFDTLESFEKPENCFLATLDGLLKIAQRLFAQSA